MESLPVRHPYKSPSESLLDQFGAGSEIGRLIRKGDAKRRLAEMAAAEDSIRQREAEHQAIADRIARMVAEHELAMQYLMQFGVVAAEREAFRLVLLDVTTHGGLGLREAAELAHAVHVQRNGSAPELSAGPAGASAASAGTESVSVGP